MAITKAKILSVTSVRGGTGKTTTALNLAATLSLKKYKVLVIDLDLYESAIGPVLNITNDENIYTLASDMLNGYTKPLNAYITKYNNYIDCLLSPNDPKRASSIYYKNVENIEKTNYKILVNKSLNKNKENYDNFDLNNILGTKVDYIIPNSFYQKNISEYENKGQILLLDKSILKNNKKTYDIFNQIVNDLDKEVLKIEKIN